LKQEGFQLLALEQSDRAENIFEASNLGESIVLVLGNEVDGVSEEILNLCDRHLEIPMHGKKTSLNVSVAAGIALFAIH
jgi:tRNA G18 (ribose-2'-O)-methylase SpoU